MAKLLNGPLRFLALDGNGNPVPGAKLFTYEPGTLTAKTSYTDSTLTTVASQPIVCDSGGRALVYLTDEPYRLRLTAADGTTLLPDGDIETGESDAPQVRWATEVDSAGGRVVMGAVSVETRTANTAAFNQHMTDLSAVGGGTLYLPAGRIEFDSTLNAPGGVNGASCVNVVGQGIKQTHLMYYGTGVAVNLRGEGTNDRIICTWEGIHLNGDNAGATAIAIQCGWNMRATPLLRNVWIERFGHYGLDFQESEWNVTFDAVEIDQCGRITNNSSGIHKNPAVDGGVFNGITFNDCQIEGCGNSTSAAGGINMPTTTANRGLRFNSCIVEGNFGTNEILISNTDDVQFDNLYVERLNVAGQTTGVELVNCTGGMRGGYIAAESGSGLYGVQLKTGSNFGIAEVSFGGAWGTAAIDVQGSSVRTGRNQDATIRLDSTAQIDGDVKPAFIADKNGTNQTGIVTATFTKVTFGTERVDATGAYDAAASTFTPKTVGTYQIDASVTFTAAVDQTQMIVSIYRSGTAYRSAVMTASGTGPQTARISCLADCRTTGETFEVYARQSSGSNKDISGSADETYFTAVKA